VAGPLQLRAGLVVPEAELRWRFSRSSGPGGQHVNTSDSRAELSVELGRVLPPHLLARARERLAGRLVDDVLTVAASEHRSQLQNREAAAERLATVLREAVAPPPPARRATRPTKGSKERRLQVKRQRSDLKRSRRVRPQDD
jgi:ribosome-associated protein